MIRAMTENLNKGTLNKSFTGLGSLGCNLGPYIPRKIAITPYVIGLDTIFSIFICKFSII